MFLTAILGVLSGLPGVIGDTFKKYYDYKTAVLAAQTAQTEALITAQLKYQTSLLAATTSGFKQLTFWLWFAPWILAMIAPNYAKAIFDNLGVLPTWYTQTAITLLFAVWGIQTASATIGAIFTNVTNWMDHRRGLPANLFYQVLRKVKGPISESDVKLFNRAMEEIGK